MKFTRYMLGNFFKAFFLVLLGTVVMFVVIDFVSNIRMWLNRGLQDTGEYYLNYLPNIVYLIMPIAVLIAVIGSLGGMARHLELTSYQGAGVSGFRMLKPLLFVGILLSMGMFAMGELVLPDANHRRLEMVQPNSSKKSAQRIKEKSHFAFVSSTKQSWYFQFYSSATKKARNVILVRFDNGRVVDRYDAQHMHWNDVEQHWQMIRGHHRKFLDNGNVVVERFESISLAGLVTTRPDDIINERQTGDEMNSTMIRDRIEVLRRSGEETRTLETQWHFKYSGPLVALVTLLIGASLAHRYSRSGGISQKFGIGLFVAFSYYVSIKVGLQMGEGGVLSPWLGAWIANILFGLFALVLLFRSFRL